MKKENGCFFGIALIIVTLLLGACDSPDSPGPAKLPAVEVPAEETPAQVSSSVDGPLAKKWTGDLDDMQERRIIRALVVYNTTNFFFDEEGRPRGASYEMLDAFERFVNRNRTKLEDRIYVVKIPVRRDQLMARLQDGYADMAAANLTITDERKEQVDFSTPLYAGVKEIIVTGPGAPSLATLEDLAGKEVWVRESSSYYSSLVTLSKEFEEKDLPAIKIRKAEEQLETEDLLEMVAAGVIGITVADDYLAQAWVSALSGLTLHPDLVLRENGEIGWMFRQDSPLLQKEINAFMKKNKKGSLFANVLIDRYYTRNKWLKTVSSDEQLARLKSMHLFFQKYADKYDFDWLMIVAQAYQESGLDQSRVSHAGAIGVMQLLESTAKDPNVNIPDIHILENNIHAGSKYMRFILDRYYSEAHMDKLNQQLFAFASYNAGPARISRLRAQAEKEGLDPNVWFQNVEIIAARDIGRETVDYVSNIFKYYVAYKMAFEQMEAREKIK